MTVGFFESGVGRFHPVSRIKSFRELERAKGQHATVCLVQMDDGTEVRSYKFGLMEALRAVQAIVPAVAGTQLITLWTIGERSEWGCRLEPVIGWRASAYGGLNPVVLDSYFSEMSDEHGVLFPDGRVASYQHGLWSNLEEFKNDQFDREEEDRLVDAGGQAA